MQVTTATTKPALLSIPVHVLCISFSDGMSRSGTFITCMSEIERVKVEGGVDIFQTVKAARTQRPHMVNTSVSYCNSVTGMYAFGTSLLMSLNQTLTYICSAI